MADQQTGSDNAVIINYIVIDPQLRHNTPYPITIPRSLFERISFGCRDLFVQEIAKEFHLLHPPQAGWQLVFWKPRREISIDECTGTGWPDVPTEVTESFEVIPFISSLSDALQETVEKRAILHIAITNAPFHDLRRLAPQSSMIQIGSHEVVQPRKHHVQDFSVTPSSTLPGVLIGLRDLDIGQSGLVEIHAYVDNLFPSSFRSHVNFYGSTKIYGACLEWLSFSMSPLLQSGSVDSRSEECDSTSGEDTSKHITFPYPYSAPPQVFVALSGLSCGKGSANVAYWDIRTFASNITSRGFTLNVINTQGSSAETNAQVHWLAFPEGGIPGLRMCCGEFKGREFKGEEKKQKIGEGRVEFGVPFPHTPRIFVALSQFTAQRDKNLRVRLKTKDVSPSGMRWSIVTWSDTVLHTARGNFLAVG